MGLISEKIQEYKEAKRKITPCHTNRASEIGHPCLRYHYFLRTAWDKAALIPVKVQYYFDEGNLHEQAVLRLLQDVGFRVVESQRPFYIEKLRLSGHIDGKIEVNGKIFPLEIKSVSPTIFSHIEDENDLWNSDFLHVLLWPFQIQSYLGMSGEGEAVLLLKNRLTGEIKDIGVPFIEGAWEIIEQRCKRINWYVVRHKEPKKDKDLDHKWCENCKFAHICLPENIQATSVIQWDDEELIDMLSRYEELKEINKEYNYLKKVLKEKLEGIENMIVGPYLIEGQWVDRKGYTVEPTRYWSFKIKRI